METSLQVKSNKFTVPKDINDYYNPQDIRRRWEVMYGFKDKFYLTDDERIFFLKSIQQGAKIVQIGELTLSASPRAVVPIRSRETMERIIKQREDKGL